MTFYGVHARKKNTFMNSLAQMFSLQQWWEMWIFIWTTLKMTALLRLKSWWQFPPGGWIVLWYRHCVICYFKKLAYLTRCSRRKGIAEEALCLMMIYGSQVLKISTFRAKISSDNRPSRCLFEKLVRRIEKLSCDYFPLIGHFPPIFQGQYTQLDETNQSL